MKLAKSPRGGVFIFASLAENNRKKSHPPWGFLEKPLYIPRRSRRVGKEQKTFGKPLVPFLSQSSPETSLDIISSVHVLKFVFLEISRTVNARNGKCESTSVHETI